MVGGVGGERGSAHSAVSPFCFGGLGGPARGAWHTDGWMPRGTVPASTRFVHVLCSGRVEPARDVSWGLLSCSGDPPGRRSSGWMEELEKKHWRRPAFHGS